jgi:hypothetical protein
MVPCELGPCTGKYCYVVYYKFCFA